MAKTGSITLPPTLEPGFRRLARIHPGASIDSHYLALQPTVSRPQPDKTATELTELAREAATWLADRWCRPTDKASRSRFIALRQAEIRGQEFNPDYWYECDLLANNTQYAEPTILPFEGIQDPNYYDPTRLPTQSGWNDYSDEYGTPTFPADPPEPSPGFEGEVTNGYFTDLWMAQQAFTFSLPAPTPATNPRPLGLLLEVEISATSSLQGNRAWFTVQHRCECYQHPETPQLHRMVSWYERHNLYLPALPPPNAEGWNHTVETTLLRYANRTIRGSMSTPWNRCQIVVAVPPTQGRYFAGNDAVSVRFDSTPTLYLPIAPDD